MGISNLHDLNMTAMNLRCFIFLILTFSNFIHGKPTETKFTDDIMKDIAPLTPTKTLTNHVVEIQTSFHCSNKKCSWTVKDNFGERRQGECDFKDLTVQINAARKELKSFGLVDFQNEVAPSKAKSGCGGGGNQYPQSNSGAWATNGHYSCGGNGACQYTVSDSYGNSKTGSCSPNNCNSRIVSEQQALLQNSNSVDNNGGGGGCGGGDGAVDYDSNDYPGSPQTKSDYSSVGRGDDTMNMDLLEQSISPSHNDNNLNYNYNTGGCSKSGGNCGGNNRSRMNTAPSKTITVSCTGCTQAQLQQRLNAEIQRQYGRNRGSSGCNRSYG